MFSAAEANRSYFQDAYRTGIHGWEVEKPSPYAVACLRRISKIVPGGRLLDIGCGEGRHSFAARRLGFRVTAMDFEPLALTRARRFARLKKVAGVVFRRASVLRLPFPDSSFDVALDYGCLHHQRKSDWPAYKANLLRVLKPDGFYILTVFSPRFIMFRGSRRPWHVAQGAYRRRFLAGEITALFSRQFEIMDLAEDRENGGGFWHALMRRRPETR